MTDEGPVLEDEVESPVLEAGGADDDDDNGADDNGGWTADATRWFSWVVVGLCCLYVFWTVHPELVFRNTTPTGGDMGAHVWGPAYLRDELLPNLRLTGWTDDWYAGFPAYTFYMVVPSLMIVVLNIGLFEPSHPLGILGALLVLGAAGYMAWRVRSVQSRLNRIVLWSTCILVPLFVIGIPYNIAFKLVSVSGLVAFPAGVWYLLKSMGLRRPGPELGAIAGVAFLMDQSLFHIYGGNTASTMAGEFAFSISLTLALFALGTFSMGLRTGRYRARTAVLGALSMLCHVIPGFFFLAVGAVLLMVLRPLWSTVKWAMPVGLSGGLMAMWWYIPFFGRREYLNDMGWEKLGVELPQQSWARLKLVNAVRGVGGVVGDKTSCDALTAVTNWSQMKRNLLPFAPHSINNVGYDDPNMWNGKLFFVLAGVGALLSLVLFVRAGVWLTMLTLISAAAFVLMPQDRFWNARVLPFYYLSVYLLAAVGVVLIIRVVMMFIRGSWLDPPYVVAAGATTAVMVVLWVALGMTLKTMPGGKIDPNGTNPQGKPAAAFKWGPFTSYYVGPVRDWAKWNFEGLEAKPGYQQQPDPSDPTKNVTVLNKKDTNEFFGMINLMKDIGSKQGCGRAYWEYDESLNKYGTPMAPMLIPYFTDHCIGSMEGLYFEASSTTPFHFLVQSELSQKPSRPERFDCHLGFETTPYKPFNLSSGIKHLQMLGVRYFMAYSQATKDAAAQEKQLRYVDGSGPWQVYEVPPVDLVEPLKNDPVVWTDVTDDIHSWARPAIDWFNDESQWNVVRASDGPKDWPRASSGRSVPIQPTGGDLTVSKIETNAESIKFHVSQTGKPVLIRTSYFPNWKASGADQVYRVTPNFMVVVPTSNDVTLTYTRTPMELIAALLSFAGLLMAIRFVVRPPEGAFDGGREWFGDKEPRRPSPAPPAGDVPEDAAVDETESESAVDEADGESDIDDSADEPDPAEPS